MSDSKDLKDLLERLRKEAGAAPPRSALPPADEAPAPRPQPAAQAAARPEGQAPRQWREAAPARRGDWGFKAAESQSSWGENKEAFLFGVFSSLLLALGGVLSGYEYLSLIGCCSFMLFSAVMALALYGHCRGSAAPARSAGLAERVEALSRKVEALAGRPGAAAPQSQQADSRELEQKVEELRAMVKSLAKVVGGGR